MIKFVGIKKETRSKIDAKERVSNFHEIYKEFIENRSQESEEFLPVQLAILACAFKLCFKVSIGYCQKYKFSGSLKSINLLTHVIQAIPSALIGGPPHTTDLITTLDLSNEKNICEILGRL